MIDNSSIFETNATVVPAQGVNTTNAFVAIQGCQAYDFYDVSKCFQCYPYSNLTGNRTKCQCQFRYNVTTDQGPANAFSDIQVFTLLNINQDAMDLSPFYCSKIFKYQVAEGGVDLTNDLNSLICNVQAVFYPLSLLTNSALVQWANVLEISEVSNRVLDAFKNQTLNFTIDPNIVSQTCISGSGNAEMIVSYVNSECGFVTCPYNSGEVSGPLDILINYINQLVPNLSNLFNSIFSDLVVTGQAA